MENIALDNSPSALDGVIPQSRIAAVHRALAAALPGRTIEAAERLSGGGSGAGIFKLRTRDAAYVLRLDDPPDGFRDPVRQYVCHRIAAAAGLAPALVHADPEARLAIAAHIEADTPPSLPERLVALGATLAKLHAAPLFPPLMPYLDAMKHLLKGFVATEVFPSAVLTAPLGAFDRLVMAYPEAEIVSSHNDLNPRNVLFAKGQALLIDWESGFAADRYVDLATALNFFTSNQACESMLLTAYFSRPPTSQERARTFLMQQVSFLFYGVVLINAARREMPALQLTAEDLHTTRLSVARRAGMDLTTAPGRAQAGCVFLSEALQQTQSRGFSEALACCRRRTRRAMTPTVPAGQTR